jgi:hypothetical protein
MAEASDARIAMDRSTDPRSPWADMKAGIRTTRHRSGAETTTFAALFPVAPSIETEAPVGQSGRWCNQGYRRAGRAARVGTRREEYWLLRRAALSAGLGHRGRARDQDT